VVWLWISAALAGWTDPTHPEAGEPFNAGVDALNAADPVAAEGHFREATALDPAWGRAALGVAMALTRQDRAADALALLEPLALEHPDEVMLWTSLSEVRFTARDFPGAEAAARRAITLAPADLAAHHALVDVLLRTGEPMTASAALDAAEASTAGPAWACLRVRIAAETKDLGRLDALLADCQGAEPQLVDTARTAAAAARGERVEAGSNAVQDMLGQADRAIALLRVGRVEEATALADALVAAHPRDTRVHILRGRVAYVANDPANAIRHYRLAFDGDDWIEVHRDGMRTGILTHSQEVEWERMVLGAAATLAALSAEAGQVAEARQLLERARGRFGERPELDAAAAWVAMASDRPSEAWDALERALAGEDPGVVDSLASDLVFTYAASLPEPMIGLLGSVKGHPGVLLNAAAGLTNHSRGALGLPLLEAVWDEVTDRPLAVGLGYTAAIQTRDLEAAGTWHARALAAGALDPLTVRNHVSILLDAAKHEAALALLAANPGLPDHATFRVLALTELESTTGLEAAALADGVDPVAQYNAAVVFANGDKPAAAVRILEVACDRLDAASQADCRETLAALKG
jgi:predicted Zn-dependent protease